MTSLIDLTMVVHPQMPVNRPDHFPPKITPIATIDAGGWAVSEFVFDSHCGTHVDVPSHVIAGGRSLDEMPLDTFVGPAQKVRIEFTRPGRSISVEDLPPIMRTRIIFHTGWSDQLEENPEGYFTEHTDLTEEAARYLVTLGVQVVGIDCPSVDRTGNAAHMVLLGSNVIIIENLTNTGQLPDFFDLITLPLRIQGVDGCPVRAVAITGEVTQ